MVHHLKNRSRLGVGGQVQRIVVQRLGHCRVGVLYTGPHRGQQEPAALKKHIRCDNAGAGPLRPAAGAAHFAAHTPQQPGQFGNSMGCQRKYERNGRGHPPPGRPDMVGRDARPPQIDKQIRPADKEKRQPSLPRCALPHKSPVEPVQRKRDRKQGGIHTEFKRRAVVKILRVQQRPDPVCKHEQHAERRAKHTHPARAVGNVLVDVRQHGTGKRPLHRPHRQAERQQNQIADHHLRQYAGLPVFEEIRIGEHPPICQRPCRERCVDRCRPRQIPGMRAPAGQFVQHKHQKARPQQVGVDPHKGAVAK